MKFDFIEKTPAKALTLLIIRICCIDFFECRYIASDCDAVATVYEYQKYAKSAEDAVAYVLKAGIFLCFCFVNLWFC